MLDKLLVFQTADRFFSSSFVHNHCPLGFLSSSGKNVTPAELNKAEREQVLELCDAALAESIKMLRAKIIVGIGACSTRILSA